jgi:hypothetical protein
MLAAVEFISQLTVVCRYERLKTGRLPVKQFGSIDGFVVRRMLSDFDPQYARAYLQYSTNVLYATMKLRHADMCFIFKLVSEYVN